MKTTPRACPSVVDTYLAGRPAEKRAALEDLRKTIRAALPSAQECISYGVPTFRVDGKSVAGFSASAKHCSYYPMSSKTVDALSDELAGYETSKGTIRFAANKPLPATLVRKLVKARLAEIAASTSPAKKPRKR